MSGRDRSSLMDSLKSKNQIHPTTTPTATTTTTTTTTAPQQSQAKPTTPNQEQSKSQKLTLPLPLPLPSLRGQGQGQATQGQGQEKRQLQYILNKKRGISQIEKVGTRTGNQGADGSSNKSSDHEEGRFVSNPEISKRRAQEKKLGVGSQSRFLSLRSSAPFSNFSFGNQSTGTGTGTGADTVSTVSTIFTNLAGLERFDDAERLFASVVLVPLKDKDADLRKELELLSLRLPVPLSPSTMTWVKFFKVFNQQGEHIFSAGEVKDPWANPFKNKWHFLLYVFTSEGEPIFTIAQRNEAYCRHCRCRSHCGWKCTFTCCSYRCRRSSRGPGQRGPSSDPEYDWLTHKEADTYLNRKFGAANLHGIRIRSADFDETDREEVNEEEFDDFFEEEERFPGEGQCHIHVSLLNGVFLGHIWVGLDSYTIHDLEYNPVLTVQRSHRGDSSQLRLSFQSVESVAEGQGAGGQSDLAAKSGEKISVQQEGEAQKVDAALEGTTGADKEPSRGKVEGGPPRKEVEIQNSKNKLYYSLYMEAAHVGSIRNDVLLKEFGNEGQTHKCISAQFPLFFDQEDKALILAFILSQGGSLAEPCGGNFCRLFVTPYSITCFVLFLLVVALIVGLVLWKLDLL